MMKVLKTKKSAFFAGLVILIWVSLLVGASLAQSGDEPDLSTRYIVERGTVSGGSYHLTSLTWQVDDAISGGGYRLLGPTSPTLQGAGCCCTYLPCIFRNY